MSQSREFQQKIYELNIVKEQYRRNYEQYRRNYEHYRKNYESLYTQMQPVISEQEMKIRLLNIIIDQQNEKISNLEELNKYVVIILILYHTLMFVSDILRLTQINRNLISRTNRQSNEIAIVRAIQKDEIIDEIVRQQPQQRYYLHYSEKPIIYVNFSNIIRKIIKIYI